MTSNDLEDRLERLRSEWPAGSIVENVMARIETETPGLVRRRHRLFAGLAASGLVAALGLAWLIVASQPTTLLAAVQDGLKRARLAHLVITAWDDRDAAQRAEIWYRRDEGLRFESPEQVIVEDGKTQWSWQTGGEGGASGLCSASAARGSSRRSFPGCSRCRMPRETGLGSGHRSWTAKSTAGRARASPSPRPTPIVAWRRDLGSLFSPRSAASSWPRRTGGSTRSRSSSAGMTGPGGGSARRESNTTSRSLRRRSRPGSPRAHGWSTATRPSRVVTRSTGHFIRSSWAG